jgi:hypothetical protein
MEASEREIVLVRLRENRDRLFSVFQHLTPEQQAFRPAPDRWSAADCVEHIIIVENFVLASIRRALKSAPEPGKRDSVSGKEKLVLRAVPDRRTRVKGPDAVMPTGRWPSYEDLLVEFDRTRTRTVQMATDFTADPHDYFFPHPIFGDLDCYQWLLFMGTHCERHILQFEEVKTDPAYPGAIPGLTSGMAQA